MMRKILFSLGGVVLGALLLHSLVAVAKPVVCKPDDTRLDFGSATYNGAPVDGGYTTDAGVTLAVTLVGRLTAPDAGATCGENAKQVTVRFVDPWTGEQVSVSLGGAP